ncbi:MAG: TetR/AcrR family transcriptional regulator [bacterium]|nr:TetR/AcrR family transcriptional regulator [bacterium]
MTENTKKSAGTDRRVRRTRSLLQQGLIQLMETKDVKDISVKELSDLADINRGTFYLHYTDIYDMLEKMEDELFLEFNEILDRTLTCVPDSSETTLNEIFAFLERHKAFARVTMGPHGDLTFVKKMKKLVQERLYSILTVAQKEQDLIYIESFIVSGCTGVIETWLNHPSPKPPEEIAKICEGLLRKGFHLI